MEGTGSVADEESDPSEADSCREVGSAVSDSGDSDSEDISGFESCSEHGGEAAVNAALIDNDDGEQSSDEEQEPESNEQADGARCSLCEASIDLAPEALVALPDKWCDGVCDRELPRREMRYRCPRGCDFDICTACAGCQRPWGRQQQLKQPQRRRLLWCRLAHGQGLLRDRQGQSPRWSISLSSAGSATFRASISSSAA
jgi:hypothetical protein